MKASCLPPNSAIESGRPYVTHMLEKGGLKTMRRQTLRGAVCIHQCRRKALSTKLAVSMIKAARPAFINVAERQHAARGDVRPAPIRGAFINVAERR